MISIIVPVYNTANYLPQCVDSIICQSYTDWELILVDDGSKDQSGMICDEYAKRDNRIMVIHQSNNGVSSARNAGINYAKGEYLCFVDADDWLEPSFLIDFQFDKIKVDFYIGGYIFNTYGTPFSCKKYEEICCSGLSEIRDEFFRQNLQTNGYPWGKLYKSSIIRENNLRFNEKLSINEDHLFVFQYYLLCGSLSINSTINYQYRVFDDGGNKLSLRKHSYNEYMEVFDSFNIVIANMRQKWNLNEIQYKNLLLTFVYVKRLNVIEALVLNNEKKIFDGELNYWTKSKILFSSKRGWIILQIVKSHIPKWLKWCALKLIFDVKSYYYKHRDSQSAIYRHILLKSSKL